MSDEHRADVTGYSGNDIIRTPVLDRLAQTGVVFRNAYTPSPVCIPARQCMMSGQLPKTCGCEGWIDLKSDYRTFAREFSRYAYNTVCSGKLHHLGHDQMQGWNKRIAPDTQIGGAYIEDRIDKEFGRYCPAPGTGKWPNQREIEEARPAEGPYQKFDLRAVTASLDFLEGYFEDPVYLRPQSHRPLLFKISLLQPHYPFFTDQERFDHYMSCVPIYRQEPCEHPVLSVTNQDQSVNVSENAIRRATAAYYGMTDTLDAHFGQVLARLEALGENMDDWIVVYTSDHGDMLGEHGIWEKTKFYEGSVRVPLIIRWPARFEGGRIVDENVNLCDLFATLCDLAGIEIPDNLDSRSMVPLLSGEAADWNNESVSQMGETDVMIKQDHLKYQYYGEDIPEVLFDLERDPGETMNVAGTSEYFEAMSRFRERLSRLGHGPNAEAQYKNAGYASTSSKSKAGDGYATPDPQCQAGNIGQTK